MDVQPRTLKLNTPVEQWFQPGSGGEANLSAGRPEEITGLLGKQLLEAAFKAGNVSDLISQLTRGLSEHSTCLGLWLAPKRNGEEPEPDFRALLDVGENQLWPVLREQIQQLSVAVQDSGELRVAQVPGGSRRVVGVVPLPSGGRSEELLAGCFERTPRSAVTPGTLLLLVAQSIALWRKRRAAESLNQINLTFSQTFQALQAVGVATGRQDAAIALVNHFRQLLDARQAVFSVPLGRRGWQVEAISDVDTIDSRNEHVTQLKRCFTAFEGAAGVVTGGNASPEQAQALTDYRQLAGTEEAIFVALQKEGTKVGGVLLGISQPQLENRGFCESAAFLASQFAPVWSLFLKTSGTWYQKLWQAGREACVPRLRRHAWLAALGVIGVLVCPIPHRITCHSELHPVQRRYVAAPFEGVLDSVLVRGGDLVEANQLLAKMDGSPLQMERSGWQAQLAAAQKKRDSALAAGNIADSQIARSEARKCEAELELIDAKLSRLELRSPIAGVLISGDMDKVEGARLEMGKSLFEVAPLERMQVELRIPEVDIRHVQAGQATQVKFSAYPFRTWEGQIARVHPRSELLQEDNVFIAEVELDNQDGTLRPGMKGWGKVTAGWQPLGWVWLHHAWERVRYVFVW